MTNFARPSSHPQEPLFRRQTVRASEEPIHFLLATSTDRQIPDLLGDGAVSNNVSKTISAGVIIIFPSAFDPSSAFFLISLIFFYLKTLLWTYHVYTRDRVPYQSLKGHVYLDTCSLLVVYPRRIIHSYIHT